MNDARFAHARSRRCRWPKCSSLRLNFVKARQCASSVRRRQCVNKTPCAKVFRLKDIVNIQNNAPLMSRFNLFNTQYLQRKKISIVYSRPALREIKTPLEISSHLHLFNYKVHTTYLASRTFYPGSHYVLRTLAASLIFSIPCLS